MSNFKQGDLVHAFGDVGRVVRTKPSGLVVVYFTGKKLDGKFGQIKGGMDVLPQNLKAVQSGEG